jgi:hypothetical protein
MHHHFLPSCPSCPKCGADLDGATAADGSRDKPEPGSLSVCIYCEALLHYDDNLRLAELTPDEFSALPEESQREITHVLLVLVLKQMRRAAAAQGKPVKFKRKRQH